MAVTLTRRRAGRQRANSCVTNNSLWPRTRRLPLASLSEPAKVDRDSAPADKAAGLRQIFAAQCRLLAVRAEAGLPVDLRSLRNLVIVFFGRQAA